MKTDLLKIDPDDIDETQLAKAAQLLTQGEVIGFPTETVYGLGGSAFSPEAIKKIFAAKGRPSDNPLIVHISNLPMLEPLVKIISPEIQKLIDEYWPGPLTILFEKSIRIPDIVTAGLPTVAIRMPSHPIALRLIELAGVPIAAPSANLSGRPSPTTANHVWTDLRGKIPLIIDGGPCPVGVESTVIDVNRQPPMILRPGGMNLEQLVKLVPNIEVYGKNFTSQELELRPSTPGLKYRHYSPQATVILVEGSDNSIHKYIETWGCNGNEISIGIIHTRPKILYTAAYLQNCSPRIESLVGQSSLEIDYEKIAQGIFAAMRTLDEAGVDIIFVESIDEIREGLAVMNRLRKAASKIINANTIVD